MKFTPLSKSALAFVACLALSTVAGCGSKLDVSNVEPVGVIALKTQSLVLSKDASPTIEVEDVRNFHLGIHG